MYDDGFKSITNVDVRHPQHLFLRRLIFCPQYSSVVIEQMQRRHKTLRPEMECQWVSKLTHGCEIYLSSEGVVGDVRELPFNAGTFDVALDKGWSTFSIPLLPFYTLS
jgi:hypothetical protein